MQVLRNEVCGEKVNRPKSIGVEESLLFLEEPVWCNIKGLTIFWFFFCHSRGRYWDRKSGEIVNA
jgi:hypothetical protein